MKNTTLEKTLNNLNYFIQKIERNFKMEIFDDETIRTIKTLINLIHRHFELDEPRFTSQSKKLTMDYYNKDYDTLSITVGPLNKIECKYYKYNSTVEIQSLMFNKQLINNFINCDMLKENLKYEK